MIRKIITINEEKCNGCGLCATACHEHAIEIIDGKAKLKKDDYCDGLGDCLPACPMDAISFTEREAAAYTGPAPESDHSDSVSTDPVPSMLRQWPVQLKLLSPNASVFHNADLLVAADCTAYAYGNFHQDFVKNHAVAVGCPKLDGTNYAEKLALILKNNEIKSVTIVRMEVPCCGGIEFMTHNALSDCGKTIPCRTVTISVDGEVLSDIEWKPEEQ